MITVFDTVSYGVMAQFICKFHNYKDYVSRGTRPIGGAQADVRFERAAVMDVTLAMAVCCYSLLVRFGGLNEAGRERREPFP